jgi:pimeloyl-ACP methyl ester carboxylesterase
VPNSQSLYRSPEGYAAVMAAYRASLERLRYPLQERMLPTRFGETHVVGTGPEQGRAVVLLHGWNTNAGGWWPQINALAHRYRLYAPDTIGQAGRSAPTRPSTRGPAYGEWLADVLDALELAQANLVGSSGGAWLILKLAGHAPDRIRAAALLSPAGIAPVRPAFALRAAAIGWLSPHQDTALRLARLTTPPPLPLDEDHLRADAGYTLHFKGQLPPPALPARTLRRLSAPTLLLVGQHEAVFNPARVMDRARREIPGLVAAEVVPGAGHDMTYDQPEWVNQRIDQFLEETRRNPPEASAPLAG